MERKKTGSSDSKNKADERREKRRQIIRNSSDRNLKNLYAAYLDLSEIKAEIQRKNANRSDSRVFLSHREVTRWFTQTEKLVREIYSISSRDYDIFLKYCKAIPMDALLSSHVVSKNLEHEYMQALHLVHGHLEGMIDSYIQLGPLTLKNQRLDLVLETCRNFPRVVNQLAKRHNKREAFVINDEYDVQDLLHALLSVHFADIRAEESCPSFSGLASRIDFFLKEEGIGIEVKMTSENMMDKKLLPQLTEDLKQYQTNSEIKTLVIFIYDPKHLLKNPHAFINDLSGTEKNMEVKVVISPLLA